MTDYREPMNYLIRAGYVLRPDGLWQPKPGVTHVCRMTSVEWECMKFLYTNYNFGGLYFEPPPIDLPPEKDGWKCRGKPLYLNGPPPNEIW